MLDVALKKDLIELLARSFKSEQIDELGRLVLGEFDVYRLLNAERHITMPPRSAAECLVAHCRKNEHIRALIQLLVETDGSKLLGRPVYVDGIEPFLEGLTRGGLVYDFERRRLIRQKDDPVEMPNWGSLREGREYPTSICSVDLAGSSELVRKHGLRRMRKVYFLFRQFIKEKLRTHNARIWSWNGDGGIIALAFKEHESRAIRFALDFQLSMPVFNTRPDLPIDDEIQFRIGIDSGTVRYASDTGAIVSDVINFAAHLEKKAAKPGGIAVSQSMLDDVSPRLARPFSSHFEFEGRPARSIDVRLDAVFAGEISAANLDREPQFAE